MPMRPDVPYSPIQSVLPETQAPNDQIRVEAQPADFGSQIGAATQQLGDSAQRSGADASEVAAQWQSVTNKLAVDHGFNQHQQDTLNALYGDPSNPNDHGYLGLTGADALNARAGVSQKLEQQRQAIMSTMQNPLQRVQFDDASKRLNQFALSQIGYHADQQFRTYGITTQSASQDIKLRSIGVNYADDTSFQHDLADGLRATDAKSALAGASDEEFQDNRQKFTAAAYATRAQSMAATDPSGALQFVMNNRAQMGANAGRMIETLQPKVTSSAGKAIADSVWSGTPGNSAASQPIADAIHSQESGGANTSATSIDGAMGGWQIKPDTFKQYALPGEIITNPQDNAAVGKRIISDYTQRYNGDAGRVAVAYFSGPGNVAPAGSATPWITDAKDGNGKSVSSYVNDVQSRMASGSSPGVSAGGTQIYPDVSAGVQKILAQTAGNPELQRAALSSYEQKANLYRLQTQTDREQLQKQSNDAMLSLEAGKDDTVIPESDIRANFPPPVADDMISRLQVAKLTGQVMKGVTWGTPEDIDAARADLSSGLGTRAALIKGFTGGNAGDPSAETPEQFGLRQRVLAQFNQAVTRRQTALSTDPAGYAAANPTVHNALVAIDPNSPATFENYARVTAAVQKSLGVQDGDVRVLSAGQSLAQAKQLLSADPTKVDVGSQLDTMAGSYGTAWPQVWHDLVRDGHMPPGYQVLAQMPAGPDRINVQRALQTANSKGGVENMRKDIDPQAAADIDKGLDGVLDDFRRTVMIPGLASNPGVFTAMRSAVRTTSMFNVLNGQDGTTALANAVKAAVPYDFDGLARAPKGEGDLATATAETIQNGITASDLAPAQGGVGMRDADRQEAYAAAVRRGATWVTDERGDGWVMAVKGNDGSYQFPLKKDGQRYSFKFSDMNNTAPPAMPAPQVTP